MKPEEDEILSLFFSLLHKIRDILIINRPELFEYMKKNEFQLIRDPFGRYFQIILFIGEQGRVSMSEFASHFKLKGGTATGIIDQLVERDVVKRVYNPSDRRKVEITLTEQGKDIYLKSVELQRDEIRTVLDALEQEEKAQLKRLMKKINKAIVIKRRN